MFFPLSRKKRLLFALFEYSWIEKGTWSDTKGLQSKFNIDYDFNTLPG